MEFLFENVLDVVQPRRPPFRWLEMNRTSAQTRFLTECGLSGFGVLCLK